MSAAARQQRAPAGQLRVVGVDPGLARCGVAALSGPLHRPRDVRAAVVRTNSEHHSGQRLLQLRQALTAFLAETRPSVVAVEQVLFNANATTAIGVSQAAGVALMVAAEAGLVAVEYTPSQVKATVTGSGDADKAQVGLMVAAALGLASVPGPADATDALALALCHLQRGGSAAEERPSPRLADALARAGPGAPVVASGRQGGTATNGVAEPPR